MMKWHDFTDESERTLTPFFSGSIIAYNIRCVILTGFVLAVMWPRQPLYYFLESFQAPFLFFQVCSTAIIGSAYLNLRCGRGEMVSRDYFSEFYEEPPTREKEQNFFGYALVGFLLHTAFLTMPFVPLLTIAAIVSGIPIIVFGKALIVFYSSALLCRIAGFILYLQGGRSGYSGYFITRLFILVYLFATILFYPSFNPLQWVYECNKGMVFSSGSTSPDFEGYVMGTGTAIGLFSVMCQLLIVKFNRQMKET